ncbi:hypothetical protein NCS52_00456500 [Fusarium sp. LHS14.1]|nr:hypothetical protein NCS52_00456500 [Fusarium sp. LHS14.1]
MDATQPGEHSGRSRQPPTEVNTNDRDLLGRMIVMPINKNSFVTEAPTEAFRLTFIDVMCLVINRMIGTGIFDSPKGVIRGVRSPGIAILFWLCGCVYALAGAHVYVEYGLNVPRYVIDGVEQSVPRSGGDLHYLQYVFPWPRYKKGIVMLSGVLYCISFICIGNMAGNCINCALRLVEAANPATDVRDLNEGMIRGIAIVIAIFPCLIHAFSRRGGILLNNLLAFIKVLMLIFMIIATWAVAGGPAGDKAYAQAFLSIIFAFSGFDQDFILGEIKHPRKTYPRSMWWGVGMVSALYMAVNICYMIIVPTDIQETYNVAQAFFYIIFNASPEDPKGYEIKRAVNAFLAISSFGNIVVMTYTAARMKQEIAKQGFIPFTSFFASNRDVSLGKFLMWLEGGERKSKNHHMGNGHPGVLEPQGYDTQKVAGNRKPRGRFFKFLNPSNHREKTPVGALVLHFASCIVLILATLNTSASDAYSVLSGLIAYLTSAWFGIFLALGILILHFRGPPTTQPALTRVAKYKSQTGLSKFVYLCEPEFDPDENSEYRQRSGSGSDLPAGEAAARSRHGGLVLSHETIYTGWEGIETEQMCCHEAEMIDGVVPLAQPVPVNGSGIRRPADPPIDLYEDMDFPEFSQNGAPVQEPEPMSHPLSAPVQSHENGSEQGLTEASRNASG